MTGNHAAPEATHPRALDELRTVMATRVEMLIQMDVQPPPRLLGDRKEEIQEGCRILRQRWGAPHTIGPRGERRLHPGACGGQVPGCRAGEQRDDLQPEAVVPPLAQVEQRLDAAGAYDGVHIGV